MWALSATPASSTRLLARMAHHGLLLLSFAAAAAINHTTTVHAPAGSLRGFVRTNSTLRAFRGIPYAEPPLGDRRWRPPVPAGRWSGVRDATQFGAPCLQAKEGGWATVEGVANASEDCLFLNVVAPPPMASGALHPVVVYFHAGEFHYGAASDRESDWPFSDDIVLVTPNSRRERSRRAHASARERTGHGGLVFACAPDASPLP